MLDIGIVVFYLIFTLFVGIRYSKNVQNMKSYSEFNRPLPVAILVATIFATNFESASIFGFTERIISTGLLFSVMYLIAYPLSLVFVSEVFIPKMRQFKGFLTSGDVMEKLYGKPAKIVTGIAGILLSVGYISAQVSAIGFIFQDFLNIDRSWGIIIGCSVVLIYSIYGGLKSVIYTDLIQFAIIIVTIPMIANLGLVELGGYSGMYEKLIASDIKYVPSKNEIYDFVCLFIMYMIPFIDPTTMQRLLLSPNIAKIKRSMRFVISISVIYHFIIMICAIVAFLLVNELDPNLVMPSLIKLYLPVGVKGLVIAGLLAAIMSTVDSYLNVSGVSIVHDVINPLKPNLSDKTKLLIARATTVFICIAAIIAAISYQSIIELILFFLNFWGPIIVIPLIAGVVFELKTDSKGFLAASGSGLLVVIIWTVFSLEDIVGFDSLVPGMILNGLVLYISKYFVKYDLNNKSQDFNELAEEC